MAEAQRKSAKRAAEKEEKAAKRLAQTNEDWICNWVNKLALDIPKKSQLQKARRDSNAKYQASKREKERQQNAEKNTHKNDKIVAAESANPNLNEK